jgi:hypothetical protein
MRKLSVWGLVVVAASCGGGDEPADPATARAEVAALLPGIVDDSSDSLDAAGDAQGMVDLRAAMTSLERSFAGLPFDFPLADDAALVAKALAPQTAEERPGAAAARWLAENVFSDANHEGDGVFRIRGAAICPIEDGATAPDPECVANIDAAELRVRVGRASGGGLNLTLLVGPDRDEPLTVRLRVGLIDVAVDLGEARSALQHLAAVVGEELDLPATMRGVVAFRLQRHAARHVEASFAVRSAVEIAGSMDGGPYAFTAAARDPMLSVELNAVAGRFTGRLDVGAVSLRAPWSAVSPDSLASGAMAFDLRGLTGELILDAAGLALVGAGLGGGPLTVKLDGATLLSVAVETFDLGIAAGAARPTIDLDPGLEVEVIVAMRPLADAGDEVESWALDERFTISVGPSVQPLEGAVLVADGAIDLAATKAGAAVHVAEGQCLLGSEVTSGEHPVLGLFAAGACP